MSNRNCTMSYDTSDMPTRRRASRFGWFSSFLPALGHSRITRVDELPPRVLDDLGLHQHVVDALLRHRR